MNKYLLEVEAIQYTDETAKELRKVIDDICMGVYDPKCKYEDDSNYIEASMSEYNIDIEKGDWLVISDELLRAVFKDDEFEKIARRLY